MDHLALEIGELHHISIHDSNAAHACRGQVQQQGRSQPSTANTQHRSLLQPELTGRTNLRKNQMAGVTPPLISTQHRLVMHRCECPRAESGFHPRCGHHAATRPADQARQTGSASHSPPPPTADHGGRARAQMPDGSEPRRDNVDGDPGPIAGRPTAPSDPPETVCNGRERAAGLMPPVPRRCNRARSWSPSNTLNSFAVPAARHSLLRDGAPTKCGADPCGIGNQFAARMA